MIPAEKELYSPPEDNKYEVNTCKALDDALK